MMRLRRLREIAPRPHNFALRHGSRSFQEHEDVSCRDIFRIAIIQRRDTMANEEHFSVLKQGTTARNTWRNQHPPLHPDLSDTNISKTNPNNADICPSDLTCAELTSADLTGANLAGADLTDANLFAANLGGANLIEANLGGANLVGTNLREATLTECRLYGLSVWDIKLTGAL